MEPKTPIKYFNN